LLSSVSSKLKHRKHLQVVEWLWRPPLFRELRQGYTLAPDLPISCDISTDRLDTTPNLHDPHSTWLSISIIALHNTMAVRSVPAGHSLQEAALAVSMLPHSLAHSLRDASPIFLQR